MSNNTLRNLLHSDSAQTSPYAVQLAAGFRSLRFIEPLEEQFRSFFEEKNLSRGRSALLVGCLLFGVFAVIDYHLIPDGLGRMPAIIQLGFICPILLMFWMVSFSKDIVERYQRHSIFLLLMVAGLGLDSVIFVAHLEDYPYRYEGLILVTMYAYFLAGLVLSWAITASSLVFLGYIVAELLANYPTEALIYNFFYLLSANIIGMLGGYGMEYLERKNFLQLGVLQSVAERDGLTGILNRRAFDSGFERLWLQSRRGNTGLVVALFDIDCFKSFNDVYGHLAGDDALKGVADALVREPHRPLDLVARFGGEEFAAVWFDALPEILPGKPDALRRAVEGLRIPHRGSTVSGVVTVSVGAVHLSDLTNVEASQALEWADAALYEAKQKGRNRAVCYHVVDGERRLVETDDDDAAVTTGSRNPLKRLFS